MDDVLFPTFCVKVQVKFIPLSRHRQIQQSKNEAGICLTKRSLLYSQSICHSFYHSYVFYNIKQQSNSLKKSLIYNFNMFIQFLLLSLPTLSCITFFLEKAHFEKKNQKQMYHFDERYIHSILNKKSLSCWNQPRHPGFDNILTNIPEYVKSR